LDLHSCPQPGERRSGARGAGRTGRLVPHGTRPRARALHRALPEPGRAPRSTGGWPTRSSPSWRPRGWPRSPCGRLGAMPAENSFDVVCKIDMQEVTNALDQARREIENRYDLKGTKNEIVLEKTDITLTSADDMKLKAVTDIR